MHPQVAQYVIIMGISAYRKFAACKDGRKVKVIIEVQVLPEQKVIDLKLAMIGAIISTTRNACRSVNNDYTLLINYDVCDDYNLTFIR